MTLAHLGYVGTDGNLFWLKPRILRSDWLTARPRPCLTPFTLDSAEALKRVLSVLQEAARSLRNLI